MLKLKKLVLISFLFGPFALADFKFSHSISMVDALVLSQAMKPFYNGTPRVEGNDWYQESSYSTLDRVLEISCSQKFTGGLQVDSKCRIDVADFGKGTKGNTVTESARSKEIAIVKLLNKYDANRLWVAFFSKGGYELKSSATSKVQALDGSTIEVPLFRFTCTAHDSCQVVVPTH